MNVRERDGCRIYQYGWEEVEREGEGEEERARARARARERKDEAEDVWKI